MPTIADSFLADIIANPSDDTARLIYADWLEENGQEARAACIRHQISFRGGVCGWTADTMKQDEVGPLPPIHPAAITFRRGFVAELTCTHDDWIRQGKAIVRKHPIESVVLVDKQPELVDHFPETNQWTFFLSNVDGASRHHIHNSLWRHMGRTWYPTAEQAVMELNAAALKWARS